jgi:ADP-heptose:LPS heptosyltransferase
MLVISIEKTFTHNSKTYLGSHRYLASEYDERELRGVHSDCLGINYDANIYYRLYTGQDLTDKSILITRSKGLGDLLMIEPVVRGFKLAYPKCKISVASDSIEVLKNHPDIVNHLSMPCDFKYVQESDYHLHYQGLLEGNSEESKTMPAVDLFLKASHAGVEDKVPKIFISTEEEAWIKQQSNILNLSGSYVIAMQIESSNPTRNLPVGKYKVLIDKLAAEKDIKLILVGNSEQQKKFGIFYKNAHKNVILATNYTPRQIILLTTLCDMVFGPDSFLIQVGGALSKKIVGVYNAFPSRIRMSYFKNAIGLDAKTVCSPCFNYRDCIHGVPPPCFQQISADDILVAMSSLKPGGFSFSADLKPNDRTTYAKC